MYIFHGYEMRQPQIMELSSGGLTAGAFRMRPNTQAVSWSVHFTSSFHLLSLYFSFFFFCAIYKRIKMFTVLCVHVFRNSIYVVKQNTFPEWDKRLVNDEKSWNFCDLRTTFHCPTPTPQHIAQLVAAQECSFSQLSP